MPARPPLVIAVAGTAEVTYDHIEALLADHLRIGPEANADGTLVHHDERAITFVIKGTPDLGPGVINAVRWALIACLPLDVLVPAGSEPEGELGLLLGVASNVDFVEDLNRALVDRLIMAERAGNEVELLLAWGDSAQSDTDTQDLLEKAHAAGICIKDLSAGLSEDLALRVAPKEEKNSGHKEAPPLVFTHAQLVALDESLTDYLKQAREDFAALEKSLTTFLRQIRDLGNSGTGPLPAIPSPEPGVYPSVEAEVAEMIAHSGKRAKRPPKPKKPPADLPDKPPF